jgi:ABC-type spermidine/putrescine transport system permease subunit II
VLTLPLSLVAFQRSGDDAVAAALALVFLVPALGSFAVAARFLRDNS